MLLELDHMKVKVSSLPPCMSRGALGNCTEVVKSWRNKCNFKLAVHSSFCHDFTSYRQSAFCTLPGACREIQKDGKARQQKHRTTFIHSRKDFHQLLPGDTRKHILSTWCKTATIKMLQWWLKRWVTEPFVAKTSKLLDSAFSVVTWSRREMFLYKPINYKLLESLWRSKLNNHKCHVKQSNTTKL